MSPNLLCLLLCIRREGMVVDTCEGVVQICSFAGFIIFSIMFVRVYTSFYSGEWRSNAWFLSSIFFLLLFGLAISKSAIWCLLFENVASKTWSVGYVYLSLLIVFFDLMQLGGVATTCLSSL